MSDDTGSGVQPPKDTSGDQKSGQESAQPQESASLRLFHGGIDGLRVGDLIKPGHDRKHHEGCPWCEARAKGDAFQGLDGPSQHPDQVYATPHKLYARYHASLWGRGDLYRVEPVGDLIRSTEDTVESYRATAFRVQAVLDRAVLLTWTERRRLWREWGQADKAVTA